MKRECINCGASFPGNNNQDMCRPCNRLLEKGLNEPELDFEEKPVDPERHLTDQLWKDEQVDEVDEAPEIPCVLND